MRLLLPRLTAV